MAMYVPAALMVHPDIDEIVKCYEENIDSIATYHREGNVHSIYNFELADQPLTHDQLLEGVFRRQTFSFKANASLGFILQNKESRVIRYYHASCNNAALLDHPKVVDNQQDFADFVDIVNNQDYIDVAGLQRPTR